MTIPPHGIWINNLSASSFLHIDNTLCGITRIYTKFNNLYFSLFLNISNYKNIIGKTND